MQAAFALCGGANPRTPRAAHARRGGGADCAGAARLYRRFGGGGEKLSSEALAGRIKELCDAGREITFVIGSSCGLCPAVKAKADMLLSFSDMVFPHQLMRIILCEQIYRAFMINAGSEYHK
ncbi:MAG TPA: 23S rRNA (pseudouridine(1915)-N(3))-methyltransferase RlmH [Candidatus Borkfalkia excrementipullorum]|nr:23S rRNA (pseudouridine(1915)-N(3))-methyltransferase RlmH [Candidatus Borkfalkia excrementipullorum]